MNVLSLFDGISCGQVALERAGIKVDNYYASEIEESAIAITQYNYPNTIQLGDVTLLTEEKIKGLGSIDLLIGGSPCTDLSNYKYYMQDSTGLEGKSSRLFYEYLRIKSIVKPKYFLLENVASMKEKWKNVMSELMGCEPILINSALVCAAERKRLYWTNIPNIGQPKDKGIVLRDIVLDSSLVEDKYWYNRPFIYNGNDKKVQCTLELNGSHRQAKEVYNLNGKCNTLMCDGNGGNIQKKVYQDGKCRKLTPLEYERLQTLPDNYTLKGLYNGIEKIISNSKRYNACGNGWTVDIIAYIFSHLGGTQN